MLKLVYKFLIFVFNFGEVLCVDLKKIIKIFKYFNRILLVFMLVMMMLNKIVVRKLFV